MPNDNKYKRAMQCILEVYIKNRYDYYKCEKKIALDLLSITLFSFMPGQILLSHLHILYSKHINANVLHNYTFAHTGDEVSLRKCGRELAAE